MVGLYQRAGEPPPLPPADLARLLVAIGAGVRLEQAAEPGADPVTRLDDLVARLIERGSRRPGAGPPAGGTT